MAHKLGIATLLTGLVAIAPFINPLVARADTFQYTFLDEGLGPTIGFSFTEPTLASSGEVTSGFFSIIAPAGDSISAFSWNSAAGGACTLPVFGAESAPDFACASYLRNFAGGGIVGVMGTFAPGSFLAPGTYTRGGGITVTITDLSVPEPSSLVLLGTGVLILFGIARKKRLPLSSIPE